MNNQWRDNANHQVVWADGTYDVSRTCDDCHSADCRTPIHKDRYKTIGTAQIEKNDSESSDIEAMGYWKWMLTNQPLGSSVDFDGETVVGEFSTANPDNLREAKDRASGVTEQQHDWMQEAYALLTPAQRQAWDAVMRDQISETELAAQLGVSQPAVSKNLKAAKVKVTNYLKEKQADAVAKERMSGL